MKNAENIAFVLQSILRFAHTKIKAAENLLVRIREK
jgi:hypothetical protein